jgi:hypothetical protein
MENERLKIYNGLKADGETNLSFINFKKKFFGSQQAVVNFHQMLIVAQDPSGNFYYTDNVENFFKKYACDLFSASNFCIQEGFPKCASRMGKAETISGKTSIVYTSGIAAWGKPQVRLYQSTDGKTGPYEILNGTKKDGTGTYSCSPSGATFLSVPVMPNTNAPDKKTQTGNQAKIITKSANNKAVYGTDAIIY